MHIQRQIMTPSCISPKAGEKNQPSFISQNAKIEHKDKVLEIISMPFKDQSWWQPSCCQH